ncbi:MAG: hypothetical protein QGH45_05935 [Myxococcota bacterium]|nr:hypothetical protein [Myxococcota bacterium]
MDTIVTRGIRLAALTWAPLALASVVLATGCGDRAAPVAAEPVTEAAPAIASGDRQIPDDVPEDRRHRLDINPTRAVVVSAISADGLAWAMEPGIRIGLDHELHSKMATAPTPVQLPDGRVRVYFGGVDLERGDARVMSAVSADGLAFQVEPGIRIRNDSGFATDPTLFTEDGQLVAYFCSCGEEFRGRFGDPYIQRASSDDGLVFRIGDVVLRQERVAYGSPEVFRTGDNWLMFVNGLGLYSADAEGRWRQVLQSFPPPGGGASVVATDSGYRLYYSAVTDGRSVIRSAVSGGGLQWTEEPGIRLQTEQGSWGLLNGDVLPLPDGRLRLYLNYPWNAETDGTPTDLATP